ncbi:CDP-glycerol glycerophosphotransferase family protein [Candidatus Saccharibacteria bacterium]|nr:CDP-glycerol glycerophosphotransferase family protein [Candidatus Saccharibacteria bacterium]
MRILKGIIRKLLIPLFYIFRLFKIDNRKVLFLSYFGKGYGDNCKYIVESLQDCGLNLVWTVRRKNSQIPPEIKQVRMLSFRWFYEMSTARVLINNCRMPSYVRKRRGQYYIQVWHGAFMFKKIEFDAPLEKNYVIAMKNDNKMVDVMLSNSKFNTDKCRTAFRYSGKVLEVGTPREEALVKNKKAFSRKIREEFGLDNNTKIILYAPTFRNDYSKNPYDIDFSLLKRSFLKAKKKKCVVMVRLHPNVCNKKELIQNRNEVIDVTDYPDMQELLAACDILITDYSSTMLEALLVDKEVIIYATDIDDYSKERGYYFDFDELPYPIAKNNKELNGIIMKEYDKRKYNAFKRELGIVDNSHCIDSIKKLIISYTGGLNGKK